MKSPVSKLSKLSPGLYISDSNAIIQVKENGDTAILNAIEGPQGPVGPPGDVDMNEILYMIREEISMAVPPPQKNEWVFDVKRDDKGLIETVVARK